MQRKLGDIIASTFSDYASQHTDELNKIIMELGISDDDMISMMSQFDRYKWIVKLNTQANPTIVDYGKYAIELFTGIKIHNDNVEENKRIMFKLKFGRRMESDRKVSGIN